MSIQLLNWWCKSVIQHLQICQIIRQLGIFLQLGICKNISYIQTCYLPTLQFGRIYTTVCFLSFWQGDLKDPVAISKLITCQTKLPLFFLFSFKRFKYHNQNLACPVLSQYLTQIASKIAGSKIVKRWSKVLLICSVSGCTLLLISDSTKISLESRRIFFKFVLS